MRSALLVLFYLWIPVAALCESPLHKQWGPPPRPVPLPFYPKIWELPISVNDSNTQVTFKIDSTFKLVIGHALKPSGKVWLADPKDPLTVRAIIDFPVAAFDTGSSSRDAEMRDAMAYEKYPAVHIEILDLEGVCAPAKAEESMGCTAKMKAKLTIRDVTKEIGLPYEIFLRGNQYEITGEIPLRWDEYNVEDPSGFFTHLDKTMRLSYRMTLPLKENKK